MNWHIAHQKKCHCPITCKGWVPATHSDIRWRWETTLSPWVSCIAGCANILTHLRKQIWTLRSVSQQNIAQPLCWWMFSFFFHAIVFAEMPMAMSDTLLYTSCPDCLVVLAKYPTAAGTLTSLELLSKTFDTLTWWITRWNGSQINSFISHIHLRKRP